MLTVTYYKVGGRWYLDAPEYLKEGGNPDALERIGNTYDLLEYVSLGSSSVQLILHTEPFEGADEAVLIESTGQKSGARYLLHSLKGQVVEMELWINEMIYYYHKELPTKIFGKVL